MRLFSRVVVGPRIVPLAALFVGLAPLFPNQTCVASLRADLKP